MYFLFFKWEKLSYIYSFFFVSTGVLYKDDCPAERFIPIYLIVMGSVYILKSLIDLKLRVQRQLRPPEERDEFKGSMAETAITNIIGCFSFAFFITGKYYRPRKKKKQF